MSEFPIEIPEKFLEKAKGLEIFTDDIEESFVTGSGKGGQKINKTASCVYLKHLPSGIDVKCQKHRERSANRVSAYKLLILKIEDRIKGAQSERQQKIFKIRKQKIRRSKKSKEKMMEEKSRRGEIKKTRKDVAPD